MRTNRRTFLTGATIAAASAQTARTEPVPLPKITFHGREMTRLVIGSNPLYGYSHFNPLFDRMMREWMTPDKRQEVLHMAERAGIDTWQLHYTPSTAEDLARYQQNGGKMNILLLSDYKMESRDLKDVLRFKPLAIAHHGNKTDELFREGKLEQVHDFVKAAQDLGLKAGVSMHNPNVMAHIEDKGWQVDYYMTCMYRVSRTAEEARKEYGESAISEIYMERDPERMTAMVRQTKRPCFAFKLLGAGRQIRNAESVEKAVRYVLANIKPGDGVIMGMFPKYQDEPRMNAELVARFTAELKQS